MINKKSLQQFNMQLNMLASKMAIPVFGGFELTSRCNLNCKMCYVKNSAGIKRELTAKDWIKLGEEACDNGALNLFLTGGEPLIRSDFKEIYKALNDMGLRLNIFTNGVLVTDEFAKWLSQSPPATVDITLYGSNEETYQKLCGQRDAFKKARSGIECLIKHKINTRLKTTIIRSNINDYKEIKNIAKSYDLEFIPTGIVHGNRENGIKEIDDLRLTPKEVSNFHAFCPETCERKTIDYEALRKCFMDIPAMSCSAGKSSFFINWKGRMVPCALFEEPFTEPLKTGYKKAWDILREEIKKIPSRAECGICKLRPLCPVCPARLKLESGEFNGHSDYICRLAQEKMSFLKNNNFIKKEDYHEKELSET